MPNDRKEDRATATPKTFPAFIFNRVEFAGALGDLGTLLPIAIAIIVLNGLNATNVMVTVGLFYILGIIGMAGPLLLLENRKIPAVVVVIFGGIFVLLALLFGQNALVILNLLPMSILGVLLVFSGAQLALMILDLTERKDLFVSLIMLGITLTVNLAIAFVIGIIIAYALKSKKVNV